MPLAADQPSEAIRFVDILTTASSIAGARNTPQLGVEELVLAIRVVSGAMAIEDVGEAVHPLLIRGNDSKPVDPLVRELVQRWYAAVGGTGDSELPPADIERFVLELEALSGSDGSDGPGLK